MKKAISFGRKVGYRRARWSAITGKKYSEINNLFLSLIAMSENYGDNRWATSKQMEEKGWTFKKDEEDNTLAKG